MDKPKVSIICLAYNQKDFIAQALEGFVMQKTNFPFVAIVHDDASTDGTAEIIKEYAQKYPDIIKPILQKENQYSQCKKIIQNFILPIIESPYVAMNEGDDYWTDENKLQKQVDFLDAHPECSVCFHPVRVVWQDNEHKPSIFPSKKHRFNKTILSLDDLLKHNFIQTNSVMYRWALKFDTLPDKPFIPGDWMLHLVHAANGKIGFLPDVMSVYRKWSGGVWYNNSANNDGFYIKNGMAMIRFYKILQEKFNVCRSSEIDCIMAKTILAYLHTGHIDKVSDIATMFTSEFTHCIDSYQLSDLDLLANSKIYLTKYRKYKKLSNYLIIVLLLLGMTIIGYGVL